MTRKQLDAQLGGAARAWLDEALAEAAHTAFHEDTADTAPANRYAVPPWELRFAAATATADSSTPTPCARCCSSKPAPACPP